MARRYCSAGKNVSESGKRTITGYFPASRPGRGEIMGFCIRNFLGFFLQLAPSMILCFLPCDSEDCRSGKKKASCGSRIGSSSGFSCLFCHAVLQSIRQHGGVRWYAAANGFMLCMVVLFCVFYFWILKDSVVKKLLILNLAVVYAVAQFMAVNMIGSMIGDGPAVEAYPPDIFWLFVATTAVMFPIVSGMMRHTVYSYLKEIERGVMNMEFACIFTFSVFFFSLVFIYNILAAKSLSESEFWKFLSPPFLFATVLSFGLLLGNHAGGSPPQAGL